MTSEDGIEFTVRPLPRGNTVDGAFRIHLASKDLENLGIKPGDLVSLRTEEGTPAGTGIAWRSTEAITKANVHPIKCTDIFRDAFNLKLGTQVFVTRSPGRIYHADKVTVTHVSEVDETDADKNDDSWCCRCIGILGNVEAIANGFAFEATSRQGLRKRFVVENINSSMRESSSLFYVDDHTQITLQQQSAGPMPGPRLSQLKINSDGIKGLNRQLDVLTKTIGRLTGEMGGYFFQSRNRHTLLFGPHGTGKTMILNRIADMPWRKVLRIDSATITGSNARQTTTLTSIVTEAIAQQPSVILLDDLHKIAPHHREESVGPTVGDILASHFEKLKGTRVLVVAAAVHPANVDQGLRHWLTQEIELPVPAQESRVEILKTIHRASSPGADLRLFDPVASAVGARTHGYVGFDLVTLYDAAMEHAIDAFLACHPAPSTNGDNESFMTLVESPIRPRASASSSLRSAYKAREISPLTPSIDDFEQAMITVPPTAMKEVFVDPPKVEWSEIGGCEDIKQVVNEGIEWPLRYERLMGEHDVPALKGILLYGPPGCSKTMTAQAIATSSGLNFLAVKGAELIDKYVGESERAMREVFRKARAAAPSVIFFDEIDAIAGDRGTGHSGLNMLTTLLNEMDGIERSQEVFVLAATNRPDALDPALLRPGRFDEVYYIGPPNATARREIFKIGTARRQLAEDVNLDELAEKTEGFSGADIRNLCNAAKKNSFRRTVTRIEQYGVEATELGPTGPVTAADFDLALATTRSSIDPGLVASLERWRDGARGL